MRIKKKPLWNITILTIPSREDNLKNLLQSLGQQDFKNGVEIHVVYNYDQKENHYEIEEKIKKMSPRYPVSVFFNNSDTSICAGRNFQLNISKSPLICFIDDDITVHGDVFTAIEETLKNNPLGLVGMPSYNEDSDELFKPRDTTPSITIDNIKYMPIQGMLVAGYRQLFSDIGGFNQRRFFWGEWTEFNLRMLRSGFPTGYIMDKGFLRHWHKAPNSPTRSLTGREKNVLWGLICTALEYDAVDINEATDSFWRLIEERYLAYSFGDELNMKNLLKTVLEITPRIARHWNDISYFRQEVEKHKFKFMPFHNMIDSELKELLQFSTKKIEVYRNEAFSRKNSKYQFLWNWIKK